MKLNTTIILLLAVVFTVVLAQQHDRAHNSNDILFLFDNLQNEIDANIYKTLLNKNNIKNNNNIKKEWNKDDLWSKVDAIVSSSIGCYEIPGASIVAVKGSDVLFKKGYGVRDVANNLPVDTNTLFGIGSNAKSVTAVWASILQSKGLLDFSTPISDYIPGFRACHSEDCKDADLVDVLTHRVGVPRFDSLWYTDIYQSSIEQITGALKYLPLNRKFRSVFNYNSIAFSAAGLLSKVDNGKSYAKSLRDEILKPLKMKNTYISVFDAISKGHGKYSYGYGRDLDGSIKSFPLDVDKVIHSVAPAGSFITSANDVAAWLSLIANGGALPDGTQLIPLETLQYAFTSKIGLNLPSANLEPPFFPVPNFVDGYGLGFLVGSYRGRRMVLHDGGTIGHSSVLAWLPGEGIGVAYMNNLQGQLLPALLAMWSAFDAALGIEPWLDPYSACNFPCPFLPFCPPPPDTANASSPSHSPSHSPSSSRSVANILQRAKNQEQKQTELKEQKKKLSEPRTIIKAAADYAGSYNHPAYGNINVVASSDTFYLLFGNSNCSDPSPVGSGANSFVVLCDDPTEIFPYPVPVGFFSDFFGAFTEMRFGLELSVPFIPFTKSTFSVNLPEFPMFVPIEGPEGH